MLQILQVVLPVFIIIGAGYLAASLKLFSFEQANALMRFATQFAIPCLLFNAIANLDLGTFFRADILISFYTGAVSSFILTMLIARMVFKQKPGHSVAIGFSALFSNSVLIGIVIVELAYGLSALEPAFAVIAIHAPFCYIVGITAMEFSRADGRSLIATCQTVLKAIFTNALTIGILLGFFVNLSGLALPAPATAAIELMVRAALPVALFGLGTILFTYTLSAGLGEVSVITINKLILHPIIAFILSAFIFKLPAEIVKPIVIIAAMPPGINAYIFANMYNRAKDIAASAVLLTTAISIVSISVWLVLLEKLI